MDNNLFNQDKKLELKKHANAIHCSNNLSLVQRKLFNALLFNAYPNLPHKNKFVIKVHDLCQLIGYNSKDIASLKKSLLGLISIAIEWNVIECNTGKEKSWKASSILSSAELLNGICIYEYSETMKELLYQPDIYGQVNIDLISKFKSSYGLALYENCIRYKRLSQTPWFPLDIFKKLMGVFDGKYKSFCDFKKRVIDISVKEVNDVTKIKIYPEIERENKKVTKIRFKLEKKTYNNNFINSKNIVENEELIKLLTNLFGFSIKNIELLYSKYEQDYISEKIKIILSSENFINGKIRGLAGYLIDALKKDYKKSKSSKEIIKEKEIEREEKKIIEKEVEEKENLLIKRYKKYVDKKINDFLSSLTNEQYNDLINEFKITIINKNQILLSFYKKYDLEHPAIKSYFSNFLLNDKKNALGTIISIDDFKEIIN